MVANIFFKMKDTRYWTSESPDLLMVKQETKLTLFMSSQRGILKKCEMIAKVDIGSDHTGGLGPRSH